MPIFFYTTSDDYGAFSNFSRHGIEMDGLWWRTVEHYFQAQKFRNKKYKEQIQNCGTPKQAKALGLSRKVRLRSDWEEVKGLIMEQSVRKKFQTHDEIAQLLISTAPQDIIENAPGDYYWGCGADGTGLNKLGKILVKVRSELMG